jgi:hypothetical protein
MLDELEEWLWVEIVMSVISVAPCGISVDACPRNSIYKERVNAGPIWTGLVGSWANCVSPTVSRVLACSNLDGDMPAGNDVERLSPDALIANCRSGISRSIRSNNAFIPEAMATKSSRLTRNGFVWTRLLFESTVVTASMRRPSETISL